MWPRTREFDSRPSLHLTHLRHTKEAGMRFERKDYDSLWDLRTASEPDHPKFVIAKTVHHAMLASPSHTGEIISIRWIGNGITTVIDDTPTPH